MAWRYRIQGAGRRHPPVPQSWERVISFIDRSGKRRDIWLMDAERHRLCVQCYGRAWPAVRAWLRLHWLESHGNGRVAG